MNFSENRMFQDAENLYSGKNYEKAILLYSEILKVNPSNEKARMLAILTEMVMNKESGGEALYDYYYILLSENIPNAEGIIQNILDSIENKQLEFDDLSPENIQQQLMYADGISYSEFKEVAVKEKGFKKAFQDITFTTKVIITSKRDLIDFLNHLIKYGFYSSAINYLDNALSTFPNDKSLQFLANKLGIESSK
jgi:tetratricopeptide (TPR) repeat protein